MSSMAVGPDSPRLAADFVVTLIERAGIIVPSDTQAEIEERLREDWDQVRPEDRDRLFRSAVSTLVDAVTRMHIEEIEAPSSPMVLSPSELTRAIAGLCPGFWPFC
jgi:hypothetical protein